MEQLNIPPLKLEVSHVLSDKQFNAIREEAYLATLEGIEKARRDSKVDSDLIYSKAELRRFLNNCSADYLEELIAKGLPQGRILSERKRVWSKRQITAWLLKNEK